MLKVGFGYPSQHRIFGLPLFGCDDPGVNALLVGGCNPLDDPELEVRLAALEPLLDVFLTCIALPVGISGDVLDICKEVSFESLPVSSTNSFRRIMSTRWNSQATCSSTTRGWVPYPIHTRQVL